MDFYHPEESQLLTTVSDRKVNIFYFNITYWETCDGQAIRMLDGSEEGEVNALAITKEGQHFVSGGEDQEVKLLGYDEGICYFKGQSYSGTITRITISPDQKSILLVETEGAIFIWKMHESVLWPKHNKCYPLFKMSKNYMIISNRENNNKGLSKLLKIHCYISKIWKEIIKK